MLGPTPARASAWTTRMRDDEGRFGGGADGSEEVREIREADRFRNRDKADRVELTRIPSLRLPHVQAGLMYDVQVPKGVRVIR